MNFILSYIDWLALKYARNMQFVAGCGLLYQFNDRV